MPSLVAIMPAKIGTPTRLPSWTIELKAISKYTELWIIRGEIIFSTVS